MRITSLASCFLVGAIGCASPGWLNEPRGDWEATYEPPRAPVVVKNVEVGYEGPEDKASLRAAASLPASNADRPRPDPVFFHLGAGHGALSHIDLRPCRDVGLPPGYLRVRVTFRPSGRVVRAAVQTDSPPSAEALSCVGEQLEVAMVPAFDGDDVTLSRIFFLN